MVDKEQGIPGKTLNATVIINAGTAGSQPIVIEFSTPEESWIISQESLELYNGESKNISISNTGEEALYWSASSNDFFWIKLDNINGKIEPGKISSLKVSVDLDKYKVGTYIGNILLTTKGGKSESINVKGIKKPYPVPVKILNGHSREIVQDIQVSINSQVLNFPSGDFKIEIEKTGMFRLKVESNRYILSVYDGNIDEFGRTNPVEIYLRPIPHFARYIEDPTAPFGSLSGICFSSDGSRAYASDERGSVIIIDAISDSVIYHVPLGGKPMGVIANPSNDELYIADSEANQVVILNTLSREIISRIDGGKYPQQLAISRDGKRLYVTCRNSRSVVLIDTIKRQTVDPPFLVGREPYGIALSPSDERILYVANFGDNNVYLIDASNGQQLGSVSVLDHPQYLAVSKDYVYVSNSFGDQISVIDQASKELIKNIRIGNSILLSDLEVIKEPNNKDVIYVIDQTINDCHPIDSVTMEMTKDEIPVGELPIELAIRPDLTKIYVINSGSANISVLEF
jgi:YVTN family beta-propeller protein